MIETVEVKNKKHFFTNEKIRALWYYFTQQACSKTSMHNYMDFKNNYDKLFYIWN